MLAAFVLLGMFGCDRSITADDVTPCDDPQGCDSDDNVVEDTEPPVPADSDIDVPDDTDAPPVDNCGNGQLDADEVCDDGLNDGSYGGCLEDCSGFGPYCGDTTINGPELCDDGVNDGSYGGCASDCLALGPYCGDGLPNGSEICDDGVNDDSCGSCRQDCLEVGSANFLVEIVVDAVPDEYGWILGDYNPDLYVNVSNSAGLRVWTSPTVVDTQPAVRFVPSDLMVDGSIWQVDVYDEDDGTADDYLGAIRLNTGQGIGQETSDELIVSWSVERLICD
jgi:hypothetical protein